MFSGIRLLHAEPKLDYFRFHKFCFILSIVLCLVSIGSIMTKGLNFGVDFAGGILIEARRTTGPVDLQQLRSQLGGLNLGGVSLQEFGSPNDVQIRVERQAGGEKAEAAAVELIRTTMGGEFEFRRVDVVGPKVGDELIVDGILAVVLSLAGIMAYMAFRFGWRAGLSGVIAILHDCLTTVGLFSVLEIQFDLNIVAAVVMIAGFSINDTVVIDDRIRENLRRYKALDFRSLINKSVNETMSRTLMTNGLVFLATLALILFGGPVLFGLAFALLWGVIIGSYSTIYVAAPLEWYLANRSRPTESEADVPARP